MPRLALVVTMLALGLAGPARAEDPAPPTPPPPPEESQDPWWPWGPPEEELPPEEAPPPAPAHGGLFVRVDGGMGYFGSGAYPTPESTIQQAWLEAPAGIFGASIGGSISESMVVAGEFWGAAYIDPQFQPRAQPATPGGAVLYAAGVQVTWYWQPANIYLSVTPSVTWLQLQLDGQWYRSQAGFGVKSSFGWEWRLAPRWGFGPAVQLVLGTNQNDAGQTSIEWFTFGLGLAFSLTYN